MKKEDKEEFKKIEKEVKESEYSLITEKLDKSKKLISSHSFGKDVGDVVRIDSDKYHFLIYFDDNNELIVNIQEQGGVNYFKFNIDKLDWKNFPSDVWT